MENNFEQNTPSSSATNAIGNLWSKAQLGFKVGFICFLVLVLMIPTFLIGSLIDERFSRNEEAVTEIQRKWSGQQIIIGPRIHIPYKFEEKQITISPDNIHFLAEPVINVKHLGIFDVPVYTTEIKIDGNFSPIDLQKFQLQEEELDFSKASICITVSDYKGIPLEIPLKLNEQSLVLQMETNTKGNPELSAKMDYIGLRKQAINFSCNFSLKGSENLGMVPIAKNNNCRISSKWQHPGFNGQYLPDEQSISDSGFIATWKINQASTHIPKVSKDESNFVQQAFYVKIMQPINNYTTAQRSVKYALLIIGLTFLLFFFLERLGGRNIHFIQYALVGFALVIFYSLLVSISEHLSFQWSYLIAAFMTCSLISLYVKGILHEGKLGVAVFGTLSALYTFIYILIQQEDYALLMGSVGLFVILAIVMYFSRRINWHQVK